MTMESVTATTLVPIASQIEPINDGINDVEMTKAQQVQQQQQKKNRIQVSNTKKPLFFYVNLAKRYIQQHNEVELSALGMAITTVVTIAEILKNNGLATEKKVLTSTVGMKDENKGRLVQKAKLRSPSHANSISVPGSPAWILPKLMVWLLLFVTVTYVFYTLRLVSTSQPRNDDLLSRHRSSQPHHLSLVALSGNDSTDNGAATTRIALPRREIEERPEKQPTDLQHVVFGIAASAKLWEQRKEYIKI
ncbi:unnamed protein product [Linum tenue]|uniref:DNA/RNA-binding protein Alba-like domain-containing protein n=1 Tax=Linum tenue TaxID=586396 RepID=A0AAV0MSF0_9ROSI|nr:unnamed protein product [Linum tenue]